MSMKIKLNYARQLWLSLLLLVGVAAIAVPGLNGTNSGGVAKIGSTEYGTLQEAVDAAQQAGGSQTISLIGDVSGETVTIKEVADFKLTIDGKKDASSNYTVDARIVVDGLRGNGGSNTNGASVTIQNIAFVNSSSADGIQPKHYPHHLTIQDCTYTGSSSSSNKWFINVSDAPLYNATIKNVTVENSRLIQASLGLDVVFENIIATNNCTAGFNIKTEGTVLIKNCQITTAKYAFRDMVEEYVGTITLENNTFISTSTGSDEGAIVNRGGKAGSGHINVESGNYTGQIIHLSNLSSTNLIGNEGVLAIYGGTFSEAVPASTLAEGYGSFGNADGTFTVKVGTAVAKIGDNKMYESLETAFAAAQDGETITLLANCSGNGLIAPQGKFANGLTVDFNGFKYTVDGITVGSAGTETQAFQLLKDNKITFKNGTIYSEKALMLVQNYSDLTLDNMKLDGSSLVGSTEVYTLSNNNGEVVINNSTITAKEGDGNFAFDVCRYASYPSVSVTVKGESVINGNIEVFASNNDPKDGFGLTLEAGTFNGNIVLAPSAEAVLSATPEKAVIKKSNSLTTVAAPQNYKWVDNNDGTSTLKPCEYICAIGDTKYESLQEAVNAAGANAATITLLAEAAVDAVITGNGVKVEAGQNITFDLNGLTYNVSGETVGSSTTETQGFQLLQGSNITFKNGTLKATSPTAQMLIQNYSNLTLEDVTLDGTGLSGWAYALSNNSGTVNLTGSTSIIAKEGGRAFDTCQFGSYAIPTVNINTTGTITGPVEATGGKLNIENGKFDVTWVTDSHYAAGDIQITGGVFTEKPAEEYCAEGYVPTFNTDPETKANYPYAVKSKDDDVYELIDTENYPFMDLPSDIAVSSVTYKRSFSESQVNKHQAWFVPMDYTITDDDVANFTFYKLHMVAGAAVPGDANANSIYLYVIPMNAGEVLQGNRPYTIKPKSAVTDHVFTAENTKLYAPNKGSRLNVTTSSNSYDFYGKYVRESYSGKVGDWFHLSEGSLHPNPAGTTFRQYRWIIKVTKNGTNEGYSKVEFSIVEDGDATGIDRTHVINSDEVEGIYTTNGMKVDEPVRGINIIRYKNGKTQKIIVK